MATSASPYGAVPIKHLNGSPYNGEANLYYIPSTNGTALFVGDFVELAGAMDPKGEVPTITQGRAAKNLLGVVVGFEPNRDNLSQNYRAASTNRYVKVADDPNLIFKVQEDAAGNAVTETEIAEHHNADIVAGSGSTATGLSGHVLNSDDASASTAQLKIMGIHRDGNSTMGTAYQDLEVMILEHALTAADSLTS